MTSTLQNITNIHSIGIIGEGKMGSGIFYYLLEYGFNLVWVCSPGADKEKICRQFEKKLHRALNAGIIDQSQFEIRQKTIIDNNVQVLTDCDLIIEAIPEDQVLKRKIFVDLDKIVKPGAIFASNSSSINPSAISPGGARAKRFIGLHFFHPVALKNIVEFTISSETDEHTADAVESFLLKANRRFIKLNEQGSFILNRIFLDLQNEAFLLVNSGQCTYMQMDQLVQEHLGLVGIFSFFDSVGLDTMLFSIVNYIADYPNKNHFAQLVSKLTELVALGNLGVKTGEGFYKYPINIEHPDPPLNSPAIVDHLQQTLYSSAKRFTTLSHLPIDEANHAIREYFDLSKGPFETSN